MFIGFILIIKKDRMDFFVKNLEGAESVKRKSNTPVIPPLQDLHYGHPAVFPEPS